jgi:hypothetical protein
MSDSETVPPSYPAMSEVAVLPARASPHKRVSFDRHELRKIVDVYGRKVAAGEWRDYAMDFLVDQAVFSIFRRTSEMPLYRIVKEPALHNRQGAYRVVTSTGLVLKRGEDLARVLQVLDRPLKLVKG